MLDDRVRAVLARLEEEDRAEREAGVPSARRTRQIARATGRLLFGLVASRTGGEVLEIGGSRGYSTIWLAAAARFAGGRVLSLERDPTRCEAWRRNVSDAGLEEWAGLVEGDAFTLLATLARKFGILFLDAEKDDYEALLALARPRLGPGSVIVADNVLSHLDALGAYSAARQADPTLSSVTLPLDRGLEVSVVLS